MEVLFQNFCLLSCGLRGRTIEWLLACQLPCWVAAFECFAEAGFLSGGEVLNSGLAVEYPTFLQLCIWLCYPAVPGGWRSRLDVS